MFKEKIAQFPAEEAPRMRQDLTRLNFGWWGYWAPGTQPDMIEYGTSRAAAWDCPATITSTLEKYDAHPRTPDNLEVMRRWEEVRASGWLTPEQKEMLRDLSQEHILLINENREFELLPYRQISACEGVRSFLFERAGKTCVVYWHESGEGTLSLPLAPEHCAVKKELWQDAEALSVENGCILLPVSSRSYLICELHADEVERAFAQARLL